jgi:dolichyl-phosphate-mannose-protein mannosyltransferase
MDEVATPKAVAPLEVEAGEVPQSPPRVWLWIQQPRAVLGLLLFVSLVFRVAWLTVPEHGLIFDESYYVNAARVILGIHVPPGQPYATKPAGYDPMGEHPPLGKVLIAGAMRLLGDDAYGWRLVSIISGMASILLLYLVVTATGGGPWLGVLAAGLFSFDNLVLVLSRVGTLDMPLVACLLLATWFFLRGWPLAAGAACGLATLFKLNGVYGLIGLILFSIVFAAWDGRWRRAEREMTLLAAAFIPTFIIGLWLLDLKFSTFRTPWDHVHYILTYGFGLTMAHGPTGGESYPWDWLINQVQMHFLQTVVTVRSGGNVVYSYSTIDFRGAMNPVLIGAAPLAFFYSLWRAWRLHDRLALWVVVWVVATYLPYYPLVILDHRATYLYYFLPAIPAVAVAVAQLLRQAGLPRIILWGYLVAMLAGFIGYFPFRTIP